MITERDSENGIKQAMQLQLYVERHFQVELVENENNHAGVKYGLFEETSKYD